MSTSELEVSQSWVPHSCTLPTVERPVRTAEFDEVFAEAVHHVERVEGDRLRLELDATSAVAARIADLAVRETGCCSFFTFELTAAAGTLHLDISVTAGHREVLDALAARATTLTGVGDGDA